jgi:hypothetical protein
LLHVFPLLADQIFILWGAVNRLLAEVREQGTGNREQKEELRLKASKTLYF